MNDTHEQFENMFANTRKAALSERERELLKDEVRLFMTKHPVRPSFYELLVARLQHVHAGLSIESVSGPRLRPVLAGLLIVFVGAGTSYAAEGALPGDTLYTVKTLVNEPVRAALAVSNEAKVALNVAFAERRLEEAGVLAAENRLTPEIRERIEARLDAHVKTVEEKTSKFADAKVDAGLEFALDTQTSLEATLRAHELAFSELAQVKPEVTELKSVIRAVSAQLERAARIRAATERTIARADLAQVREFAKEKRRVVEEEIAKGNIQPAAARVAKESVEVEESVAMMMSAMPVADTALVEATTTKETDPVLEAYTTGNQKFEAGEYGEAFADFQKAFRSVQEEKIKNSVRVKLKLEGQLPSAAMPFIEMEFEEDDKREDEEEKEHSSNSEDKRGD